MAEAQAEVLAEEDRMAGVVVLLRPTRKNTYKFAIQVHGSTTSHATYTSVKEALTRNIQSTYKIGFEVTESLETMKEYDWDAIAPKRPISTIKEEDARKIHQEGLDRQWLEMFKLHNNRKTEFISEMRKFLLTSWTSM